MTAHSLPALPTDSTKIDALKPGSEVRRPGTEVRKVAAPAAPVAKAPPPSPAEDDSENLLREYVERQKTQLKRVAAERDAVRAKAEQSARELAEAKKELEAASRSEAVIQDLQGKVDAAILSNSMLSDENGKLKARVQELESAYRKLEEKAAQAVRGLGEAQKSLAAQTQARQSSESRVTAALQALQGERKKAAPAPAAAPARK